MALLEREQPLAALSVHAGEARDGAGRLVLLTGEAGAGKSALVTQFTAGLSDAQCYLGTCDGMFTPRPLGAFLDIADQLGGELAGRFRGNASRDELFGSLLGQLARPGGLRVVVVEDIHWADEATLDLLRFLSRRMSSLPVLLVATYRDDEIADSDPLRVALGDLAVQRCTRRVELAPLSAPAMASIPDSGGTVDGPQGREAFPRQVVIVSGGMPGWEIALIAAGAAVAAAALAVLACRSWTTRRLAAARRPGAVQAQPPAVQPPASVAGGTDELSFS